MSVANFHNSILFNMINSLFAIHILMEAYQILKYHVMDNHNVILDSCKENKIDWGQCKQFQEAVNLKVLDLVFIFKQFAYYNNVKKKYYIYVHYMVKF